MKPYRAHYIDTIQQAENSYLCFPTAPEKERKERKTNDVDVGQNLLLYKNESSSQTLSYLSCVARLCK